MTKNRIFSILKELVQIPSPFGEEHEIGNWIKDFLQDLALNPYKVEVSESGPNVVAEFVNNPKEPWLLLNGHMDTIEATPNWNYNPYGEKIGENFYGIGANDMKSGLALLLALMKEIAMDTLQPNLNILFTAVSDEECWSRGTVTLIEKGIISANKIKYAIVTEPQGLGNLVIGRRGRLLLDIVIEGKKAHAATPEKGINAINETAKVIQAIESLNLKSSPHFDITEDRCILEIFGKAKSLSVPDQVKLVLDEHYLPEDTLEDTLKRIKANLDLKDLHPSTSVIVKKKKRPTPDPEAFYTDINSPLVQIACKKIKHITNIDPQIKLGRSVADSNFIGKLGIPVIDLGPTGYNEHQSDEYVDLTTLEPSYLILRGLIAELS